MADKVIMLKLVERNSETPKTFNLQVPIGDKRYTPGSNYAIVNPRDTPWKIPFDVNNPSTAETTDELIAIRMYQAPHYVALSYSADDLNGNYIELSASPDGQIGTYNTNVTFDCQGLSGRLSIRLCSFPNPQAPTETLFNSRVSNVWTTDYVEKQLWERYRYSPNWDPSNPWGDNNWATPGLSWFNPNDYIDVGLIVQNGVRPRISFHLEKFRNPDWEAGRFIDCLVINHWFWERNSDTSEGAAPYIYKIHNQQIIAAKFISGNPFTPQKPLTPSKTPNTTPEGGRGSRSNLSADVPFSTSDGIHGMSGYAIAYRKGIHLVRMEDYAWNYLIGAVTDLNFRAQVTSFLGGSTSVDFSNYIISACRLGLPVINVQDGDGALRYVSLSNYKFDGSMSSLPPVPCVNIESRFADTETYTFNINRYSGTFLDFDPYTRIEVHVPYCGIAYVSADDCVDGKIEVKYIVDLVTGECVAQIRTTDQFGNTKISASLEGCCGLSQPISSTTFNSDGIKKAVSGITGLSPSLTSAITSAGMAASGHGNAGGALSAISSVPGAIVNAVEGVNEIRHPSNKATAKVASGGMSSILGERSLYVAVYHPQDMTGFDIDGIKQVDNFGNKVGYTAASFGQIQNYATGSYVEGVIDTSGISSATDEEKISIKSIIRNGVYI